MAPKRTNKGKRKPSGESTSGEKAALEKRPVVGVAPEQPSKDVDTTFKSVFKVSRRTFNYICSMIREPMTEKASTFMFLDGSPMPLNVQVAVALRRLSSSGSQIEIANAFEVNPSTVTDITWQFTEALKDGGVHYITWPTYMDRIKSGFQKLGGFPNCCGAIGTAHLKLHPQTETNRQNNHGMMLQVIVDAEMRIMDAVAGSPGNVTIETVLQSSGLFGLAQKGVRLNGEKIKLSDGTEVQEYIVGGPGFPLLPWLLTPYHDEQLSEEQFEFNKKHLHTRRVVDRTLKRLKEVWAVMDGSMWTPGNPRLSRIALACCLLHNIMIHMEGEVADEATVVDCEHDDIYRLEKSTLVDENAALMRDKLSLLGRKTSGRNRVQPQAPPQSIISEAPTPTVISEAPTPTVIPRAWSDSIRSRYEAREKLELRLRPSPEIIVDRRFWGDLFAVDTDGWLDENHIKMWIILALERRPVDARWTMIPAAWIHMVTLTQPCDYWCDGTRHPFPALWTVDQAFVPICIPYKHWVAGELDLRSWSWTVYDSGLRFDTWESVEQILTGFEGRLLGFLDGIGYWREANRQRPERFHMRKVVADQPPPQQEGNMGHCGVFTCIYMDFLSREETIRLPNPNSPFIMQWRHDFANTLYGLRLP